jgi:hypothetical protein
VITYNKYIGNKWIGYNIIDVNWSYYMNTSKHHLRLLLFLDNYVSE